MNNLFGSSSNNFLDGFSLGDLDINKLIVILLIITGKLDIEAIHVYRNNYIISLGTFFER